MKMMQIKSAWRWLLIFCLLGAAAARAHDAFLSNTDVWLHPDRMELKCSLASFTALLLDNPHPTNALPVLDEDNFNDFMPMLKRAGEKMFEITAGGTVLAASAVDVRLSSEGDAVDFTIIYPRPPAGPLRITAAYVKRLPDEGFATALEVFDEAQHQIAFDANLNMENLSLDLKVPPPTDVAPTKSSATTTSQAAVPPTGSNSPPTKAR
jgi:hypothetical protein